MNVTETARESLEHAHHVAEHPGDSHARRVALLIGVLAAALALGEMQEKSAQNAFLAHHITLSDDWAFYQAKNLRATMASQSVVILESLPGAATDPAIGARIAALHQTEERMRSDPATGEGMKELKERTTAQTEQRDEQLHRYHRFELVNGALQIAIVLASVSVVTRVAALAVVAGSMGALAVAGGVLVVAGLV